MNIIQQALLAQAVEAIWNGRCPTTVKEITKANIEKNTTQKVDIPALKTEFKKLQQQEKAKNNKKEIQRASDKLLNSNYSNSQIQEATLKAIVLNNKLKLTKAEKTALEASVALLQWVLKLKEVTNIAISKNTPAKNIKFPTVHQI